MTIDSVEGKGTKVTAVFKCDHPDMKPMGDMMMTMAVLVGGNPEIRFVYDCADESGVSHFDSRDGGAGREALQTADGEA